MLAFYLNNKPILLDLSASARLTWENPACAIDNFPGDVGMGITIPVNDINRARLGNPERFEKYSTDNDREFPGFEVRFSGNRLMSGTLIINRANAESYNGWLRSETGNMGKAHREKHIADIDAFNEDINFTNKANYDPLTDPYGCPQIFNPEFFYDKGKKIKLMRVVPNPDYVDLSWWQDLWQKQQPTHISESYETETFTEAFRVTASWMVNAQNPDYTIKTSNDTAAPSKLHSDLDVYVVSPMLFLNFVLKELFRDAGFYLDNDAIANHNDLQKFIIYNNFDITNMEFVDNGEEAYLVPSWDGSEAKHIVKDLNTVTRNYTAPFRYKDLLPKINLKDFILSIQNSLNVCFQFRHDGKVDIIDRETIIDGSYIDISEYMVGDWEIDEKKDVTLKFSFDHDSNDTFFQERWEDIDDRRDDEGEPVNTWEDLDNIINPVLGEIRFIKSVNTYAQYALIQKEEENPITGEAIQIDTIGWEHLAMGFQDGFYSRGKDQEEEIKTKFSTLPGDQTVSAYQRGNINSIKYAYQNFSPRLLFYHGNNIAKFETANISFDWEKQDTGLLATRWPIWSRFWNQRQPVGGKANLPLNMLNYITRNITKKLRGQKGEFIIEKMETEFGLHTIQPTTIKAFKI